MDDFERDHPGFDWKNIPAYKHPGGKDCPCPKHEYVREQIKFTKNVHDSDLTGKILYNLAYSQTSHGGKNYQKRSRIQDCAS